MRRSPNPDRPQTLQTRPTARGSGALVALLAAALVALSHPLATAGLCLAALGTLAALRVGGRLSPHGRSRSAADTPQDSDGSRSVSTRSD